MTKKNIAFINLVPHVGALPALISSVSYLSEIGYTIDFVTVKYANHIPEPKFNNLNVNEIFLPSIHLSRKVVPSIFVKYYQSFKLLKLRGPYLCIFGVDQAGMTLSVPISLMLNTRVIYFPMELYLSGEITGIIQRIYKSIERIFNKRTKMTIIQDDLRAKLLTKDNNISSKQIVVVPNSALGLATHKRGCYFNEKYGIPRDKIIILSAGNIIGWAMSYELAESALSWPEKYVLVLHGYVQDNQHMYLEKIKNLVAKSKSIIFSLDMVPYEDLDYMHSSVDIGVALYNPQEHIRTTDFENIGLSSGKLMRYLKAGLPVITSNLPNLRKLIDEYKCGICVNHPSEIINAINKLSTNHAKYSQNSIAAYDGEFEFSRHFAEVVKRVRNW